jgi:hypothetical protein
LMLPRLTFSFPGMIFPLLAPTGTISFHLRFDLVK